ncbi:lipopolysaccharide biosynthesis protein [Sphingomicrobium sediminis]|uniref:Uncharacterized protein n=1 Tax=Sphingomicrobium sediminis TaxID=2950949 RepID=A0A9X2EET1_9SPHN|nr:hypothetical protein [Sphingomicrobium sediminis]MCM8556635.1 hypothetical protein [Sphingomicrobium sediminis]
MTDHAAERSRRLHLAFGTGLIARIAGAIVQLVSLPIAANTLGDSGFVLFGSALALLNLLMLSQLSVGSSMAIKMGEAWGAEDSAKIAAIYQHGLAITRRVCIVVAVAALFILFVAPGLSSVFPTAGVTRDALIATALVVLGMYVLTVNLVSHEGAIMAFQELQESYKYQIAGSVIAMVTVPLMAWLSPSIAGLLLALWIPQVAARIANILSFRRRHRAELFASPSWSPPLLGRGVLVMISLAGTGMVSHFLPILLTANRFTVAQAADFTAVMNMITLFITFYALTSYPFRGALPEALARKDNKWIVGTVTKTMVLNIAAGGAFLLGLGLFGDEIFALWFQGAVTPSASMLVWAGAYFLLFGIVELLRAFLIGADDLRYLTFWSVLMSLAIVGILWLGIPRMDGADIFMTLCLTLAGLGLIPFAARVLTRLRGASA